MWTVYTKMKEMQTVLKCKKWSSPLVRTTFCISGQFIRFILETRTVLMCFTAESRAVRESDYSLASVLFKNKKPTGHGLLTWVNQPIRYADAMQQFSNPVIKINERIIIWPVPGFEKEFVFCFYFFIFYFFHI